MKRLARLALLFSAVALLGATAATAAPHMWIGFQDDASFRWRTDRMTDLDAAQQAGATIVRAWVYWPQVAPNRPANGANPFDPAYKLSDIDELVRGAQARGMEVLLTPWGTPKWANGGKTPNYAPRRIADWTNFVRAVALRYSGRYEGYPAVRFWSIWNEPNLNQFLAPQFVGKKDASPATYAKLFRVAYAAIKSADPTAFVAAGETSPRGHDKPIGSKRTQDSHSPGKFAQLLAAQRPRLKFDAWSHHPYSTDNASPIQRVKWPNVSLTSMPRLATSIDTWFHRKNTPMWITEYGYQTKPAQRRGISMTAQASYLRSAVTLASKNPRIGMFVWFTFRDDAGNPWRGGLENFDGTPKPSYGTFDAVAKPLDARNLVLTIPAGKQPTVAFPAREIARDTAPGEGVGVQYSVAEGVDAVGSLHQPLLPMGRDGWISLPIELDPVKGHKYTVIITANAHGTYIRRELTLTAI